MRQNLEGWLQQNAEKFEEQAAAAKENQNEFDDGKYIARVTTCELEESKSSDRIQIHWGFTFLDGEYIGKVKHSYQGLDQERSFEFLSRDMLRFGYEGFKLPQLPAILDEIAKTSPAVRISLKTSKSKNSDDEFQNVYINKVLPPDYDVSESAGVGYVAPEHIPGVEEKTIELEPKVGMTCTFTDSGKKLVGVIKSLDEEREELTVTVGKKEFIVTSDNLLDLEETKTEEAG